MFSYAKGIIKQGHGVASGKSNDSRFPNGTIAMQIPFFKEKGLELSSFFPGTINLSLSGYTYKLGRPKYFFPSIKWSPDLPPEKFSFYECTIKPNKGTPVHGAFVYWPHPSTKPEFHQDFSVLEILAPFIKETHYGEEIEIYADPKSIFFSTKTSP